MPNADISRQVQSISISTTYSLTDPNITQVVANCTSAGFTLTIYNDAQSGAYHRIVVKISDSDVSGNTLTIVDAAASFSTSLAATSAAVELESTPTGGWIAVATFPTEDAATAISAADSAGVAASAATSTGVVAASEATSAGAAGAVALSAATSGTTLATSEATSAGSKATAALSAATSGTTLATSEATSAGGAAAVALSAATSAGALASSALSLASS